MLDLFLQKVVVELSLEQRYIAMIREELGAEIHLNDNQPELYYSTLEDIKNKYSDLEDYVGTSESEKSDVGVYYFNAFSIEDITTLSSLVESYNLNLQINYDNQTLNFTLKS